MNKLGLNSGYIGSDQRTTTNGVVGYDKYFLERINERFNPVIEFAELLNLYSGAAAAYSLRLLRKGYAGNAIRVRRSSDNTEANIGFDSNGNLNTATLLAFCGAGNGFVTTWYDQSGNGRDATQSTGANQPQIVSSGSVILENGKIALRFDGSDDTLSVGNFDLYSNTNGQSIISVFKALNNSTNKQIISKYHAAQSKRQWFLSNDNYNVQELATSFNGSNLAQGVNTQTQQLFFGNWIPSTSTILYQNNTNSYIATTAATDISTTDASVLIGASFDNLSYVFANIQEIIVYDFSQASNRAAIQINVNSFYSIY
jgi:hypothetical protein